MSSMAIALAPRRHHRRRLRRPRRRARRSQGVACDVTLVDRHNHHLFQPLLYQVATAGAVAGRHRLADPLDPAPAGNVCGCCSANVERHRRRPRKSRRCCDGGDAAAVRLPDRRRRRDARLLRPRRVGRARARAQDARRRAGDPAAGAAGVRGGRARDRIRRPAAAADVRDRRRRPDRRRAGRRARRDRAPGAAPRVRRRSIRRSARILLLEAGPTILPAFPETLRDVGAARAAAARASRCATARARDQRRRSGAVCDRRRADRGGDHPVGRRRRRRRRSSRDLGRAARSRRARRSSSPTCRCRAIRRSSWSATWRAFTQQTASRCPASRRSRCRRARTPRANIAAPDRPASHHAVPLSRSRQHGDDRPRRRRSPTSAGCASPATSPG